ncbi:MAG: hypothetical protein EXS37_18215 [Opitutus sp.]|nr:hypothetical protein [Opitutus sp.]
MTPLRPTPAQAAFPGSRRGFTLLDVVLALLCLGLAAYIAISEIGKIRHRAQRDDFVTELRQLASAFESYRSQSGEWPAATGGEIVIPRGMESALAKTHWLAGLPFGGGFEWVPPPAAPPPPPPPPAPLLIQDTPALPDAPAAPAPPAQPVREPTPAPPAMIAITACTPRPALTLSQADLLYIDSKIDDGNLSTGRFHTGFNGWPVYEIPLGR